MLLCAFVCVFIFQYFNVLYRSGLLLAWIYKFYSCFCVQFLLVLYVSFCVRLSLFFLDGALGYG